MFWKKKNKKPLRERLAEGPLIEFEKEQKELKKRKTFTAVLVILEIILILGFAGMAVVFISPDIQLIEPVVMEFEQE